jgi:acyl-CoA dehydrogenase
MDTEILDPFVDLLARASTSHAVRAAQVQGAAPELWNTIVASGYLDALAPESAGGAGLTPNDISSLAIACGHHLAPAPIMETILARSILAHNAIHAAKDRPILFWPQAPNGHPQSLLAPAFFSDALALVQRGDAFFLMDVAPCARDAFGIIPTALADQRPRLASFEMRGVNLMAWAGAITAACMAGAMNAILAMAIDHANTRVQFGRPLAKFQSLQHQLAAMAEKTAAANAAARFGFAAGTLETTLWRTGVAKCFANEAATLACATAHALHGAIGISQDHDLQLYARHLKRAQLSYGGEGHWALEVARPWRHSAAATGLDFVREQGSLPKA